MDRIWQLTGLEWSRGKRGGYQDDALPHRNSNTFGTCLVQEASKEEHCTEHTRNLS